MSPLDRPEGWRAAFGFQAEDPEPVRAKAAASLTLFEVRVVPGTPPAGRPPRLADPSPWWELQTRRIV